MGTDTTQAVSPKTHPEFRLTLDANAGIYNLPRKTANGPKDGWYPTSNITGKLLIMPKALLSRNFGLFFQTGLWARTTEFEPEFSKTILRTFFGPVAYAQIDLGNFRLKLVESLNYFYGVDLNGPAKKDWESHELGNYCSLSLTYKPAHLSIDFHNWYVFSLGLTLASDTSASEDGYILGTTTTWKPWGGSEGLEKSLGLYGRYRYWNWHIEPNGATTDRMPWHETTFGLQWGWGFSIFE